MPIKATFFRRPGGNTRDNVNNRKGGVQGIPLRHRTFPIGGDSLRSHRIPGSVFACGPRFFTEGGGIVQKASITKCAQLEQKLHKGEGRRHLRYASEKGGGQISGHGIGKAGA